MMGKSRWKYMPLKKTYYLMLVGLIGLPIFLIFCVSFYLLNRQYKEQAVENIRQMQQTMIAELSSDIDEMAMRMTTMIYANDYEVMEYAAGVNTDDAVQKLHGRQGLGRLENLYLGPNKQVISMYFHMSDGTDTYLKSYINQTKLKVEETDWYKRALEHKNKVFIGSWDTQSGGDLFVGGKKDMFVLMAALSPDANTDKSGKIEMVILYQAARVADRIKSGNQAYMSGKNILGITQITDEQGNSLFSTMEDEEESWKKGCMCIKTPLKVYDSTWYIESYIKPTELTKKFNTVAGILLLVATGLIVLLGYYSSYFIKNIVKPIEEVNQGLKKVESGDLDVHIMAKGQYEVRTMIHQFNAMVKQLQVFFKEYEDQLKSGRNASYYFREMMSGRMSPEETAKAYAPFFKDSYTILGLYAYESVSDEPKDMSTEDLIKEFRKNSRYASRCCSYIESSNEIYMSYRITEKDYESGIHYMIAELQKAAQSISGRKIFFCVGKRCESASEFLPEAESIRRGMQFRFLMPENEVMKSQDIWENKGEDVVRASDELKGLVDCAFMADEKNLTLKREALFEALLEHPVEDVQRTALGVIMAAGKRAEQNSDSIIKIFGKQYNYISRIIHMEDERSLRLWMTNFLNWILDYSAAKLNVKENDMIALAKRYMQDHYDNPDLALSDVADYVHLNEKYFSTRFTKETGETVSGYLTQIRMQKAKKLLKTTNYKVYEIAAQCGYHNVEHFNRVFKKTFSLSPTAFRKAEE